MWLPNLILSFWGGVCDGPQVEKIVHRLYIEDQKRRKRLEAKQKTLEERSCAATHDALIEKNKGSGRVPSL